MHRALLLTAATAVGLVSGIVELTACGDMVLRPGHSQRMRGYAPLYPKASILLYVPAGARADDVKELRQVLTKRGGHQTEAVVGVDALRNTLGVSRYDIIMVLLKDAPTVEAVAAGVPARPDVVPVAPKKMSKAELTRIERDYGHSLVEGSYIDDILQELDHVMEPRRRGAQAPLSR